ncbi:guanylin-like [Gouania willdenowi]|uniref:Guanylate cyclase activator 2B n=1 Tax=Gouania willdenowi TaxID=441366 RepID=A0A8C5DPL5_GOUWI|nr:guanylin-like [Gouania willdenowi]
MKTALGTVALLVLAVGWISEAVQVEENGFSFSLEAVRTLQQLTESNLAMAQASPRFRPSSYTLCADPRLPQEFLPLCQRREASASLARLALVPLDVCEICSFAACGGC